MKKLFVKAIKFLFQKRCKVFSLGAGTVERYTIIEFKYLFSIYLHCISTDCQDRFHTHAFNAVGWTLSGGYDEEIAQKLGGIGIARTYRVGRGWRFIPRLYNHRLMKALPDTVTLLFTGPYQDTWTEETETWFRILGKGGRELVKFYK